MEPASQTPATAEERQAAFCALLRQLGIVDESLWRIAVIMIGVALSYYATAAQRRYLARLLCGETPAAPDVSPIRIVASLLILSSLFFFTKLSKQTLCTAQTDDARCSAQIDHTGNQLVLSVALARLWDQLRRLPGSTETAAASEPLSAEAGAVDTAL